MPFSASAHSPPALPSPPYLIAYMPPVLDLPSISDCRRCPQLSASPVPSCGATVPSLGDLPSPPVSLLTEFGQSPSSYPTVFTKKASADISVASGASDCTCFSADGHNTEGYCWACHVRAFGCGPVENWDADDRKQLQRAHKRASSAASSGKSVRFCEEVDVYQTYAGEDYPGRSMHAPNLSEDSVNAIQDTTSAPDVDLVAALAKGGASSLPNLKLYW